MDKYHLRNGLGQYFCYNEAFCYEWVDAHAVESGEHVGPVSFVGREYALRKILEAQTPKTVRNMVRPDYPDMTGAWAEHAGSFEWQF